MKPRLLIFDLDGTLIDSSEDIAWAANATLRELGMAQMDAGYIKSRIGWGVKMLFKRLLPDASAGMIEEASEVFLRHYSNHLIVSTHPYPGVVSSLERFKGNGKLLSVVTNKPLGPTSEINKALGLDSFFDMVLGGDSVERKKPDPESLLMVLDSLGVDAGDAVFVGDSAVDCQAGKAAGVNVIGAAYGFRGKLELVEAGCDHIIDDFGELQAIVS